MITHKIDNYFDKKVNIMLIIKLYNKHNIMNRNAQEFFGWLCVIIVGFVRLYNYANGCGIALECDLSVSGIVITFVLIAKLSLAFYVARYYYHTKLTK